MTKKIIIKIQQNNCVESNHKTFGRRRLINGITAGPRHESFYEKLLRLENQEVEMYGLLETSFFHLATVTTGIVWVLVGHDPSSYGRYIRTDIYLLTYVINILMVCVFLRKLFCLEDIKKNILMLITKAAPERLKEYKKKREVYEVIAVFYLFLGLIIPPVIILVMGRLLNISWYVESFLGCILLCAFFAWRIKKQVRSQ